MKIRSTNWRAILKGGRKLREQADAARDRRDWIAACELYGLYLGLAPQDMAIWIQLGHTRKESGDISGAIDAYQRGLALAPKDADAHLQLGHALKLAGRMPDAEAAYRQALELDPGSPAAEELDSPSFRRMAAVRGSAEPTDGDASRATQLRRLGDLARDGQAWTTAAERYRAYLQLVPADADIWVQYGHASKEMGDAREAEHAYRRAATLAPTDADPHFHLGRLLQAQGEAEGADAALASAFRLQPNLEHLEALSAVHPFSGSAEAVAELKDHLLLDISDLLDFVAERGSVTGIQRVQIGLSTALARGADLGRFKGCACVFASTKDGTVWRARWSDFMELVDYCTAQARDAKRARAAVDKLRARSTLVSPSKGSVYLIVGAFWGRPNAAAFYRSLQSRGARVGALIHDIFAITHPELVGGGVIEHFEAQLIRGTALWDFIIANSAHTAREVERYIAQRGLRSVPVKAVALAHRMGLETVVARPAAKAHPPRSIQDLEGKPFVLCVGTIEARKNHAALFQVWRMLKDAGLRPPALVLVGKIGWRVDDLLEQMRLSGLLGAEIRIVEDVSDSELAYLYERCLFTVLPSFAEGWGLPIGESLDHGKVCVTSEISSMPEVGGDFAVYVDPYNSRAIYQTIHRLLTRPEVRRDLEVRIGRSFRPRLWPEVARDLVDALEPLEWETRSAPSPAPRRLVAGKPLSMVSRPLHGRMERSEILEALEAELVLTQGWCEPERGVVWLGARRGRLTVGCASPPGSAVRILLLMTAAPWATDNELVLTTPSDHKRLAPPAGQRFVASIESVVGDDGLAEIELQLFGPTAPAAPETRPIRVGLLAIDADRPGLPQLPPLRALSFGAPPPGLADWGVLARAEAILAKGWSPPIGRLAWMRAPEAKIVFRTDEPAGRTVRVVMDLHCEEPHVLVSLRLRPHAGRSAVFDLPVQAGDFTVWVDCPTAKDGEVELILALEQTSPDAFGAPAWPRLAMRRLRYASTASADNRLALLEAMLLPQERDERKPTDAPHAVPPEVDHWPDPLRRLTAWFDSAES